MEEHTMGRLLILLSLITLVFLQIGSYLFPSDPVMWLASSTGGYELTRLLLIPVLGVLLLTNPPRHMTLRYLVGFVSMGLLGAVAVLTYNNSMTLLDTLAFGLAGITMGVVALEINYTVEDVVDLEALRQAKHNGPLIQH
jgi:sorbitol-specific phosphotransferase system component IIC